MKRFTAQLNDGSFVNVAADRMVFKDAVLHVYDGQELVAYVDVSCVLCASVSERSEGIKKVVGSNGECIT